MKLRRLKFARKLTLGPPRVDQSATNSLRSIRLRARNQGDFQSAVISAGYYARKQGKPMYVYAGNSFGYAVWRVSYKPSEYLDPINNTGVKVVSVLPDLTVRFQDVKR